jgi:hypothetical protein
MHVLQRPVEATDSNRTSQTQLQFWVVDKERNLTAPLKLKVVQPYAKDIQSGGRRGFLLRAPDVIY